jgi:hypothetical protein
MTDDRGGARARSRERLLQVLETLNLQELTQRFAV